MIYVVLVPYGVSIFLFTKENKVSRSNTEFSSPMGYLYFYSIICRIIRYSKLCVLVPYGVSIFLFLQEMDNTCALELVLVPYGISIFLFKFTKLASITF